MRLIQVECILAGKLKHKKDRGRIRGRGSSRGRKGRGVISSLAQQQHEEARNTAAEANASDGASKPRRAAMSREQVIERFRAKKPAYSNCRMLALDGTELAACDLKKLEWYVSKGIGRWIAGHEADSKKPTVQLCFEHKQVDQLHGLSSFYTESRKNHCVGCGESGHYVKYRCGLLVTCIPLQMCGAFFVLLWWVYNVPCRASPVRCLRFVADKIRSAGTRVAFHAQGVAASAHGVVWGRTMSALQDQYLMVAPHF